MVNYLIDTDILINFSNNKEPGLDILATIPSYELSISAITIGEVLEGLIENTSKYASVKQKMLSIKVYPVDETVAERFAQERKVLRKSGKLIDNMDLLIASTALVHNLTLITNNTKDFRSIKGLKLLK